MGIPFVNPLLQIDPMSMYTSSNASASNSASRTHEVWYAMF